ncbi:MAG: elongation factor G [Armatimonadota bacterium]
MNRFAPKDIRNLAVVGHQGTGKTTMVEAMLYVSGAKDRMGRVEDGTTTTDFDPAEQKRGISISAAVAPVVWNGCKLNLIDTPGYADFVGEVCGALRVADAAVVLAAAASGVEVGTENAWDIAAEHNLPRILVVSKMDRENADFGAMVQQLRSLFGNKVIPIQLPIGSADTFKGVVDLVRMRAFVWDGKEYSECDVLADMADACASYREQLLEAVAETDDDLISKYLEGEELTDDEVAKGLLDGVKQASIFPVLCCSAAKQVGIQTVLDRLVSSTPSPLDVPAAEAVKAGSDQKAELEPSEDAPAAALVWKTSADRYVGKLTYFRVYSGVIKSDAHIYNSSRDREERVGQLYVMRGETQDAAADIRAGDIGAVAKLTETGTGDTLCDRGNPVVLPGIKYPEPVYSLAVTAKTKADEDKLGPALNRLAEEDPTFRYHRDPQTGETIISGMGDTHLDVMVEALKRKFGVDVNTRLPKVPYRETITTTARAQGRHKKQTGGRGQYGDCWIKMEPLPRGAGFEFVDAIVGGVIPRQYIPAVEKGLLEAMERGYLAGYPTVDIRCTVDDGSYHPVDSSEQAFKTAAHLAFQACMAKANPVLLEPILRVEIIVPEEFMGDVIGDLNTKRGRVQGMESAGHGRQLIRALVPQAEMLRYAIDLRSLTRGRGTFRTEFATYEEVPAHIAQQIIEQAKKEKEE